MKKQKVISVLLACLALAALTLASCDVLAGPSAPRSGGSQTDPAIHGTWVEMYEDKGSYYYDIVTLRSDGTWEESSSNSYNGPRTPKSRGPGVLRRDRRPQNARGRHL